MSPAGKFENEPDIHRSVLNYLLRHDLLIEKGTVQEERARIDTYVVAGDPGFAKERTVSVITSADAVMDDVVEAVRFLTVMERNDSDEYEVVSLYRQVRCHPDRGSQEWGK